MTVLDRIAETLREAEVGPDAHPVDGEVPGEPREPDARGGAS